MTRRRTIALASVVSILAVVIGAGLIIQHRKKGQHRVVQGTVEARLNWLYLIDAQGRRYWLKWMKPHLRSELVQCIEGELCSLEGTVWPSLKGTWYGPDGRVEMTEDLGGSDYVMAVDSAHRITDNKQEPAEQADGIAFLLEPQGSVRNTQIIIEGDTYEVAIITLSFGIENSSAEPVEVNIGQNIVPMHPDMKGQQGVFRLVKDKEGPYLVNVKPNDTQLLEIEFIQKPGSPSLSDHVLVSVPVGPYVLKVELNQAE